ncbi:MAG TPA: M48 family metallopeptidase [Burkholderiales bacterium]|nr:M48 family metallopeptidase [Burkholderiales bacterium]
MDFFEQQHRARRRTWLMLLLFVLAVAAIVAAFDLVCAIVYIWLFDVQILYSSNLLQQVPRSVYLWSTLATLLVIGWGTASRLYQLSGGGVAVADLIGARHVKRDTGEPAERRLLNVVEEMALASGITVPLVFVMDDQRTINAFAAGYSPNEATVIVTRGALEQLNRDELQGVVAHEFSHILNGDMRLNIHLVGVIAGIVMVGSIGAFLMTGIRDGDDLRRAGTDIRVFFLGLLLWLIGSIGVLAGRLIKAVISREREFLADASAVQFTRNPDGIGGALFKIGLRGSTIAQRHAEELSHMCIGAPVNDYFEFALFHDHPPLDDRIERLLGPGAKRLLRERMERAEAAALSARGSPVVSEFVSPLYAARAAGPASLVESIGNPSSAHLDHARATLDAIPAETRAAVGRVEGAQAALFALLLGEGELRKAQLALIGAGSGAEVAAQSARLADALKPLGARARLPVLELVIPTLKRLPGPERDGLLEKIKGVIEADRKITLGEFVLLTLCRTQIQKEPRRPSAVKYRSVAAVAAEAAVVLSLLAHSGKGGMAAFDKGMAALGAAGGVLRSPSELNIAAVECALNELNLLAPLKKPLFIKACVATAMADDKLTLAEAELLRAICATLDSPLPPILETTEAVA